MLNVTYCVTHWRLETLGHGLLGIEATSNWEETFPAILHMFEKLMIRAHEFGGISQCSMKWETRFDDKAACSVKTILSFTSNTHVIEFLKTFV